MRLILLALSLPAMVVSSVLAAEPAAPNKAADSTSATYMITGLHCPGCVTTVDNSLKKVKGVQAASVDFASKHAQVKFDETQLSAQQLANAIAATPHMMGAGMHYGGLLVLNVPDVKDEASAAKAKTVLGKVPAVAQVTASPEQHTVAVRFAAEGHTTSQQLLDALQTGGLTATSGSASAAMESTPGKLTDAQLENIGKLSPADREEATKQAVCPISGGPLGAMGMPVKIDLDGHTVFLCCEDCREDAVKQKDEVLKKLGFGKK